MNLYQAVLLAGWWSWEEQRHRDYLIQKTPCHFIFALDQEFCVPELGFIFYPALSKSFDLVKTEYIKSLYYEGQLALLNPDYQQFILFSFLIKHRKTTCASVYTTLHYSYPNRYLNLTVILQGHKKESVSNHSQSKSLICSSITTVKQAASCLTNIPQAWPGGTIFRLMWAALTLIRKKDSLIPPSITLSLYQIAKVSFVIQFQIDNILFYI